MSLYVCLKIKIYSEVFRDRNREDGGGHDKDSVVVMSRGSSDHYDYGYGGGLRKTTEF